METDYTVTLDGVTIGVRESGVSEGLPVLHFHGTPGSRLEMARSDEEVAKAGVHVGPATDSPRRSLSRSPASRSSP
jgi:hypothetical protein